MVNRYIHCLLMLLMQCQLSYSGVVTISIPKCGTYLLAELLVMLGFSGGPSLYTHSFLQLDSARVRQLGDNQLGYDHHAIANGHNIELLLRTKHKIIFIYRDPRDQILSLINYMHHMATGVWQVEHRTKDQLIFDFTSNYSLLGCTYNTHHPWNDPLLKHIRSVHDFYQLYLPWIDVPGVCTTTFEALIGAKGGGSREKQIDEIKKICNFLEVNKTNEEIGEIADHLFGSGGTFHKGQTRNWQHHFSSQHRAFFKKYAGQLLIRLGYETDLNW